MRVSKQREESPMTNVPGYISPLTAIRLFKHCRANSPPEMDEVRAE